MTDPGGLWGGPDPSMYEYRIRRLEAELAALRQRGVRDSGAFNVKNSAGIDTLFSGPSPTVTNPDGTPQWVTYIKDQGGVTRLAFYDPFPLTDGFVQVMWEWDHLNNLVRTTDKNGGWAEPWFPIHMYPMFAVSAGVFNYMATPVNVAEQVLWEGRIGYVTHPYVGADLLGGSSTGTNSNRFRLKINGVTAQTWDIPGGVAFFGGAIPILGVGGVGIGSRAVGIQLTAQSLSGSGSYGCQVFGMYMRQTP